MSEYETVAQAIRVETDENTGKVFVTFEVISEKYKQFIKKNWSQDIEFIMIGKNLHLK